MNHLKFLLSTIIISVFCVTASQAQKKTTSFEEMIEERKALMNAEAYQNRSSNIFTRVAQRSKITDNYNMQYTPRNTGDNELSSFFIDNTFVDSQGRYFFQANFHGNYAVDILDNGVWSHLDAGEELEARVNVFAEDSEGNIWVGIDTGLQKFNSDLTSVDALTFNTEDTLSDRVRNIAFDGNGAMWLASRPYIQTEYVGSGIDFDTTYYTSVIAVLDPETNSVTDTVTSVQELVDAEDGVRDFTVDGAGDVWAATSDGVIVYSSASLSPTHIYTSGNSGLPVNNVIGLETDQNGDIWVAFHPDSATVVAHFDGTNWTSFDETDIPSGECSSLTFGSGNQLYCGGEAVYMYDGSSWSELTGVSDKGETLEGIRQIASNQNGVDIFNHRPGAFIHDGGDWEYLSSHTDNGLPGNPAFAVEADSDGGFWSGGFFGTTYYDGNTWTYYDESDGLSDRYSWKIYAASDGTVWFGTNGNMSYLKDGEISIVDEYSGFYGEGIYEDRDGNIWMGSYSTSYEDTSYSESAGILMFDGTDYTLFPRDSSTIGTVILDFAQGPDDMIYALSAGFTSNELIRYDGQNWSVWQPDTSIIRIGYSKLATDNEHNLWFVAQDTSNAFKLMKWDGDDLARFSMPADVGCWSGAEALEADIEGNIWVDCSTTVAIFKVAEESWVTHELPAGRIYDISHNANGTTWVGTYTGAGIYEFNTQRAVSVEDVASTTPEQFELKQNYPNPFNPTTTIGYDLPANNQVTLKVYDLLGREVATLINSQRQSAGHHQISFNASSLASGMYIYRLESNTFTATKKMMLIK